MTRLPIPYMIAALNYDPRFTMAFPAPGEDYQEFGYRMAFDGGWINDPPTMRFTVASDDLFDCQTTVHGFFTFSERLRAVLDVERGPNDHVQWFPATVVDQGGREHRYYAPHFPEQPDILDEEASTWGAPGMVIRWVIDPAKIGSHRFFRPQHCSDREIIVTDSVLTRLRTAGVLHGVEVTLART